MRRLLADKLAIVSAVAVVALALLFAFLRTAWRRMSEEVCTRSAKAVTPF